MELSMHPLALFDSEASFPTDGRCLLFTLLATPAYDLGLCLRLQTLEPSEYLFPPKHNILLREKETTDTAFWKIAPV